MMLAALPLIEAGAVAIIGAVAGVTVTKKVMDRIENRSKTKSPRRKPKEHRASSRITAIGDSDSDSDISSLHSEGSAYGRRRRPDSRCRDRDHYIAGQSELDEEHILRLLRSLPRRKSRIGALVPTDGGRRSRGSKWRAVSPYGTEGDEPEWVQQGYESHREWYEDLDAESKEAYLGYLFDLLKQARKKTLDDLEEFASRRKRGSRRSLYAIVEKHALFEKREEEHWQQPRPYTPIQEYTDPRTRSWVNTQHPTRTSRTPEPDLAFYPTAPEFRNHATGPCLNIPPGALVHQPPNREVEEVFSEPASSEKVGSVDEDVTRVPRTNTRRVRIPRSRSSTPQRDRR